MNVICPQCGVTNRVSDERPEDASPVCGKCKSALQPEAPGFPIEADHITLSDHLSQTEVPVFLDIWGTHCPPCHQLAPVLKEIAKELAGRVKVVKVNSDQNQVVAQAFQVRGVPTLILLKNKKELARTMGFQPLDKLRAFVDKTLAAG